MATSQDGPLIVGGLDDNTAVARPLLIQNSTGALLTTGGGAGGTTEVVGPTADDAPATGNPVQVAGVAKSPDGTSPGEVAENDTARLTTDLNRRTYVNTSHASKQKAHFNGNTAYTDQEIAPAPGANKQTVISFISFSSGSAAYINLFLEEGATTVFGPIYLENINGRGYTTPADFYLPITPDTAVTFTTSANNNQSIDVQYFVQDV